MAKYLKGKFKPINPKKYRGDPKNIVYRSSWELSYMSKLDLNDNVVSWSSEETTIPYRSPIDGRVHRYFVDFIVEYKDGSKVMVEIKPKSQTQPPKPQKKKTKTYINQVMTWGINEAKWQAAEAYCKKNNMTFSILTEVELGIKQ